MLNRELPTMILAVAATEFEMQPLTRLLETAGVGEEACQTLIAGVGPVETTLRLTRFLAKNNGIGCVLNFGVAGAYVPDVPHSGGNLGLLDLCLAEQECLGDFGLCYADRVEALDEQLTGPVIFPLDGTLRLRASEILTKGGQVFRSGNFVTVAAASATRARGAMLAARFDGLCENMEGAAVARVSVDFSLPLLEVRVISNLVEDRDVSQWQMAAACKRSAEAAFLLVREL